MTTKLDSKNRDLKIMRHNVRVAAPCVFSSLPGSLLGRDAWHPRSMYSTALFCQRPWHTFRGSVKTSRSGTSKRARSRFTRASKLRG